MFKVLGKDRGGPVSNTDHLKKIHPEPINTEIQHSSMGSGCVLSCSSRRALMSLGGQCGGVRTLTISVLHPPSSSMRCVAEIESVLGRAFGTRLGPIPEHMRNVTSRCVVRIGCPWLFPVSLPSLFSPRNNCVVMQ